MNKNNKIKKLLNVGIIGLGVGMKHLDYFLKDKLCKVVAVSDFDSKKFKNINSKLDIIKTKHSNQIINNDLIDLVSIASYDNYHYEQVKKAIKKNKHIFIEKPVCLTFIQLRKIHLALKNKKNIKISANFPLRVCPRYKFFKKLLIQKKLGDIFYIEADYMYGRKYKLTSGWRSTMLNYSIILGSAIHMIDLVVWLLDQKPISVFASGNKIATKKSSNVYNSFSVIILKFRDNLDVKITGNGACIYDHYHELKIFGKNATIISNKDKTKLITLDNKNIKEKEINAEYPAKHLRYKIFNSFVRHIINSKNNSLVSKREIFDVMSIAFSAEESMKKNKLTTVKYL